MASKNANAMDLNAVAGICTWDGTSVLSTAALTQYNVLTGGASANAFNQIAPSTAGQLFTSAGASSQPTWTTSTYPGTNAINTLLYASAANVMSALATANSGVLITSSGGVPSISSTLPSAVQGNITSVGTLSSGTVPTTLVTGATGGSAPAAGYIGQQIRSAIASGSAVSLTSSNTQTNITNVALTAGIWDVSGIVMFSAGTFGATACGGSVTTSSAGSGTAGDNYVLSSAVPNSAAISGVTIPSYRVTISSTTTYYLTGVLVYTTGSPTAYGRISATRVG